MAVVPAAAATAAARFLAQTLQSLEQCKHVATKDARNNAYGVPSVCACTIVCRLRVDLYTTWLEACDGQAHSDGRHGYGRALAPGLVYSAP